MTNFVFTIALIAATLLLLLALGSLKWEKLQFWPPPSSQSWQNRTFWLFFRLMFGGVLLLSFLDFQPATRPNFWWRFFLGGVLTLTGFGAGFLATFNLGWRNAHGDKDGLKTEGWYRWSRNPVYVVTIIGIVGLGLVVNSARLWVILVLWVLLYLVAPSLEERWLEKQYGDIFLAYKRQVPRFIGLLRSFPFFI